MSEFFKLVDSSEIYRRLQNLLYMLPKKEQELELLKSKYDLLINALREKYLDYGAQLSLVKAKVDPEAIELAERIALLESEVKALKSEKTILSRMIELINAEVIRMSVEVKALRLDIHE